MPISQICLDYDNVMVDWTDGVIRMFGADHEAVYDRMEAGQKIEEALDISTATMWKAIDEVGTDFWANLEVYPWALDLWEICNSLAPTYIATSPGKHGSSHMGKLLSMNNLFGAPFRQYQMGPNKHTMARPDAVLIDDDERNCDTFVTDPETGELTGAAAILFPVRWNSLRHFADNSFEFTVEALRRIAAQ